MMVKRQLEAGTSKQEVKRLLRRRSLFLLLFGFVHTVIISGADILAFYGIAGLLIGWLLFHRERVLARANIERPVLCHFDTSSLGQYSSRLRRRGY